MTNRTHRLLLAGGMVLAALVGGARQSRAQAMPAASGPGSYVSVGGAFSGFRNPYGQRYLGGPTVFVDLNPTWRFGLEAEARSLTLNADEGVTMKDYFAGVRVSAWRPGRLMPYGKFLVGAGKITLPFDYAKGTFFTFVPGGGVEYRLSDHFTWRAADFEYQLWQNFPYGTLRPYGISSGISFRLNAVSRVPKHAYYFREKK